MAYHHAKDEDLNGYRRGAHANGESVCSHFAFCVPGAQPDADGKKVWGWNDLRALDCARCHYPAEEHVVLRGPILDRVRGNSHTTDPEKAELGKVVEPTTELLRERLREMLRSTKGRAQVDASIAPLRGIAGNDEMLEEIDRLVAEVEADGEGGGVGMRPPQNDGLLDETNDPLSQLAPKKPLPPPPPPPPLPPSPLQAAHPPVTMDAQAILAAVPADQLAGLQTAMTSILSDRSLADDLIAVKNGQPPSKRLTHALTNARWVSGITAPLAAAAEPEVPEDEAAMEARLSAECKAEVDAIMQGEAAPKTTSPSPSVLPEVLPDRDTAQPATVAYAHLAVAELLAKLQLPQYIAAFEEEAVDFQTLALVQSRQGGAALDEALRELGVRSKGHRLKIQAALA